MTSQAQAMSPLPGICGLAFLGFPLHPAGRPAPDRGAHLRDVDIPMLFMEGTRRPGHPGSAATALRLAGRSSEPRPAS